MPTPHRGSLRGSVLNPIASGLVKHHETIGCSNSTINAVPFFDRRMPILGREGHDGASSGTGDGAPNCVAPVAVTQDSAQDCSSSRADGDLTYGLTVRVATVTLYFRSGHEAVEGNLFPVHNHALKRKNQSGGLVSGGALLGGPHNAPYPCTARERNTGGSGNVLRDVCRERLAVGV